MTNHNVQPTTLTDKATSVLAYLHRVHDVRERVNAPEHDARNVMLNNLAAAANGASGALLAINYLGAQDDAVIASVFQVPNAEGIRFAAEDAVRASRLFLLLETQFQIENGLRNVLRTIEPDSQLSRFYQIAERMIALTQSVDSEQDNSVLMVPAHLRNSMHANGVHHGYREQDTITMIDGMAYEFRHGRRVSCGSWEHIVHALSASLRVIEKILTSPVVLRLPFVRDTYNSQLSWEHGGS